jgi:hypothetical protein
MAREDPLAGVDYKTLWRIALALPGVEESTSYGTPAFKAGGKLLARLREDGDSLVVMTTFEDREILMEADPRVFFLTDHYLNYPIVLVRLSAVGHSALREVLTRSWRLRAPKRLQAERAPKRGKRRAPRAEQ